MAVKCAGTPQGGEGTRRAIHVHSGAREGPGLGGAGPGNSSHKGHPCAGLWSPAAGAGGAPALRDMTMHPSRTHSTGHRCCREDSKALMI